MSHPLSWFPSIFLPDLVNLVLHHVLRQPHILLLPLVVSFSTRPQKITNNELCAEAKVLSLDICYVPLLQILQKKIKL